MRIRCAFEAVEGADPAYLALGHVLCFIARIQDGKHPGVRVGHTSGTDPRQSPMYMAVDFLIDEETYSPQCMQPVLDFIEECRNQRHPGLEVLVMQVLGPNDEVRIEAFPTQSGKEKVEKFYKKQANGQ